MSVQVFLGEPPAHIKQWIIDHPPKPAAEPLCFTAAGSDMTVKYGNDYNYAGGMQRAGINFQYSTDGKNWTDWVLGETQFNPISIPVGTKLYLRGNNPNGVYSPNGPADEHFTFTGSGTINASGNIQSLIDPTMERTDVPENCYNNMFYGCSNMTQAPALPATTLASTCYNCMFDGCTSLAQAPSLPATTLAFACYSGMFNNCSSLTQAPALPATTLDSNCYSSMFKNCTSLTQAPAVLPATTLADACYTQMFSGCSNLTQAPALPATTLANGCYEGMFSGCTSLTQAPELPATTLTDHCYYNMFQNCSSLTQAPALPATTLASTCYYNMFSGCNKFSECHMKASMEGVYSTSTHGDTKKTVIYDL